MLKRQIKSLLFLSFFPVLTLALLFSWLQLGTKTAVAAPTTTTKAQATAVTMPDPVAYWSFDDGADPTQDLISGNHDGDLIGGAEFTTTVPSAIGYGQALALDGVDGKVQDTGNESDFDFVDEMAVSFWLKVDAFDTNGQALVTKGDTSWRVQRYNQTGQLAFYTPGLSPNVFVSSVTVDDGEWHHVAAILDGAFVTLYIDGTAANSHLITGSALATNDFPVEIGANAEEAGREFDGLIDDVRIYDVALSEAQVTHLSAGNAGFTCFSEVDGDAVTDFVSNNHQAVQRSVDISSAGNMVKLAGTCPGVHVQSTYTQTVYIDKNITLEGGHIITDWLALSDPEQYPTVLDAENNGRVVYIPSGNTVTLDGLTITNGYALGDGGGIYSESDLTIENSLIENNETGDDGGGIYNLNGTINLFRTTVQNNQTPITGLNFGGGVNSASITSEAIIRESSILSNTARAGGGVAVTQGTLLMEDSVVAYNAAENQGGGLNLQLGDFTIENSTISKNNIIDGGGFGGGIKHIGSGGASTLTIHHSTIFSNTASHGEGIDTTDTDDSGTITTYLSNTIIVSSVDGNSECGVDGAGATLDAGGGYNLDSDGSCIAGGGPGNQTNANPGLGALADNGGDTLTHALLSGSPAVDASDPTYPAVAEDYDQRGAGYPRVYNGRLDIGAYELSPSPICFVSINDSGTADYASPDASAVQTAVNAANAGDLLKVAGTCAGVQIQNGMIQTAYINKNLTIQGGYHVTNTLPTANWLVTPDPRTFPTILDAENNGRVLRIAGAGVHANINRLTLMGGNSGEALGSIDGGGGIIADTNTVVTVTNTVLQQNSGDYGGAIYANGQLLLSHTLVATNTAITDGGGLFISTIGTVTIANSTISGNKANSGEGGGIYADGSLNLDHTTISYNTGNGGISVYDGPVSVKNSIVAHNADGNCVIHLGGSGSISDDGYNLTDNYECIFNGTGSMRNTDPLLGSLADNGGDSLTHKPLSSSPVIDQVPAGINGCGTTVVTDQRSVSRPYGAGCEIGAVELATYELTTAVYGSGTITSNPSGISCEDDCTESFHEGTVVTLTAVPTPGSTFTGWSGEIITTTNPLVLTMDGAKELTATYALNSYDLSLTIDGEGTGTVNLNPPNSNCTTDCSESYDYGTVVTLTAVPETGSSFTGWYGACSGTDDCVVTMDSAQSVTATFTEYLIYLPVILKSE